MSGRAAAGRRGLPATAGIAVPSDRRFRRPDVRPGRRRRFGPLAWRVVALTTAAAGVLAAGAWLMSAVLGSRLLAVSRVQVRGNARLTSGEVEALVEGIRGQSLLRVDLNRYRRRLMDSPWVSDVTLWRVLPSTVEVSVVERVPMVVARLGQQLFLVDRSGATIDEFGPQYRDLDLPIVDGLLAPPVPGGADVDAQRLSLTARFLEALQARSDLRQRVSQVDVSDAHDVVVLLDADAVLLHLGEDRFVERLRTYVELVPTLRERFQHMDYVDLRFDEHVFVGTRGASAAALATGTKKK